MSPVRRPSASSRDCPIERRASARDSSAPFASVSRRLGSLPAGRQYRSDPLARPLAEDEPLALLYQVRADSEAGITFGSLYHQFAGTPVSPASTRSLEAAMAEATENQPHCEAVDATVHDDRVADAIGHENGYTELAGSLMDVGMRVEYEGVTVRTRMEMEDGYPLMKLVEVVDANDE